MSAGQELQSGEWNIRKCDGSTKIIFIHFLKFILLLCVQVQTLQKVIRRFSDYSTFELKFKEVNSTFSRASMCCGAMKK